MSGLALTATSLAGMLLGCAALGVVSQVSLARARTDAAADLAALAVAARVARGEPDAAACSVGAAVVADHDRGVVAGVGARTGPGSGAGAGTTLDGCVIQVGEALVSVTTKVRVLGFGFQVASTARAGPTGPSLG